MDAFIMLEDGDCVMVAGEFEWIMPLFLAEIPNVLHPADLMD